VATGKTSDSIEGILSQSIEPKESHAIIRKFRMDFKLGQPNTNLVDTIPKIIELALKIIVEVICCANNRVNVKLPQHGCPCAAACLIGIFLIMGSGKFQC
jgi:hypothetical protein